MTLRITIEEIKFGDERRKTEIATINIHNKGRYIPGLPTGDSVGDLRMYDVAYKGEHFKVYHHHDDGALVLAQVVLRRIIENQATAEYDG